MVLFICSLLPGRGLAQDILWAHAEGGTSSGGGFRFNAGTGICADNAGNVYAIGYFSGTGVYGKDTFLSYMSVNAVLIKYDAWGKLLWARQLTHGGSDYAKGICIDRDQNICITGDKSGSAIRSFVVKYNPRGDLLWVNDATGEECHSSSHAITTDAAGNLYVAGECQGIISFDSFTIGADKKYTIFLVKYDRNGKVKWVRHAQPSAKYYTQCWGVAVDRSGNIFITGEFTDTAIFDRFTVTGKGSADVFVAMYSSAGKIQWLKSMGSNAEDRPGNIVTDKSGNLYLTTYFSAAASVSGKTLTGDNLIKLTARGELVWNRQIGVGVKELYMRSFVAIDSKGFLCLAGYYYDAVALFGESKKYAKGSSDIYVAKCSPDGQKIWKVDVGNTGVDEVTAICTDKNNNIYTTGTFNNEVSFGPCTIRAKNGAEGMFVAKMK